MTQTIDMVDLLTILQLANKGLSLQKDDSRSITRYQLLKEVNIHLLHTGQDLSPGVFYGRIAKLINFKYISSGSVIRRGRTIEMLSINSATREEVPGLILTFVNNLNIFNHKEIYFIHYLNNFNPSKDLHRKIKDVISIKMIKIKHDLNCSRNNSAYFDDDYFRASTEWRNHWLGFIEKLL